MRSPMRLRRAARAAFTLVEMLISLTLFGVVIGLAVSFFRLQAGAVGGSASRLDAQQNAQFAVNSIDRELRVAGVGVVGPQPMIVRATTMAITFNTDLVSRMSTDIGAVYYDPDANPLEVGVMSKDGKISLPLTSVQYPDSSYKQQGGLPSEAETISYWVSTDSTTSRADDYILFRRVNATPPRVVSKGIIIPSGAAVFRYFKADTFGQPIEIASSKLPLRHSAPIHGSPLDSGASALTDSIRTVRVKLTGLYKDPKKGDIFRVMETSIRIMNAGLINHSTCGDMPILGVTLAAVASGGETPSVVLSWSRATDESGGEKDVERYALFRRAPGVVSFGEPFASVSAGSTTYTFTDVSVQSGESWVYGLAAQDCTPASSPPASTGTVVIP